MRKIRVKFLVLILVLSACGDGSGPEPEPPSVHIDPNFGNTDPGGTVTTKVEASAPGGFKTLNITPVKDGVDDVANTLQILPVSESQTDTTFTYSFDTDKSLVGIDVVIEFTLTDDLDRVHTSNYSVGVNAPGIKIASNVMLEPPESNPGGSSMSTTFFSISSLSISYSVQQVNTEEVSSEIDFGYHYSTLTNSATLAAPADYPLVNLDGMDSWTTRNSTKFRMTDLTSAEFEESGFIEIYEAYDAGTAGDRELRSTGLEIGDVIAFETDPTKDGGTRRGLIFVVDLQPGDGPNDFIQFKIRFEEQ